MPPADDGRGGRRPCDFAVQQRRGVSGKPEHAVRARAVQLGCADDVRDGVGLRARQARPAHENVVA